MKFPKPNRKAAKRAADAERLENWTQTRAIVLRRAGGRCELCGCHGFALDCHHLASGPLRRKYEAPNAVVAVCRPCHLAWHKGVWIDLQASIEAAERISAPDIVQANLRRRLDRASLPGSDRPSPPAAPASRPRR